MEYVCLFIRLKYILFIKNKGKLDYEHCIRGEVTQNEVQRILSDFANLNVIKGKKLIETLLNTGKIFNRKNICT